jgi:hypothetical protein
MGDPVSETLDWTTATCDRGVGPWSCVGESDATPIRRCSAGSGGLARHTAQAGAETLMTGACHDNQVGLIESGDDGTEGLERWCTSDTRWSTPECQGFLRAALISVFHNAWPITANKKTEDRQQGALLPASDPGGITRPHPGLRPGLPTGAFQVDCTVAGTSRRRAWRRRSQRQTPTAGSISRAEEGSGDMTVCSSSLASEMSPLGPTVPWTSNQNSACRLAGK